MSVPMSRNGNTELKKVNLQICFVCLNRARKPLILLIFILILTNRVWFLWCPAVLLLKFKWFLHPWNTADLIHVPDKPVKPVNISQYFRLQWNIVSSFTFQLKHMIPSLCLASGSGRTLWFQQTQLWTPCNCSSGDRRSLWSCYRHAPAENRARTIFSRVEVFESHRQDDLFDFFEQEAIFPHYGYYG